MNESCENKEELKALLGKWVRCHSCGTAFDYYLINQLALESCEAELPTFCPKCGAKLRREKKGVKKGYSLFYDTVDNLCITKGLTHKELAKLIGKDEQQLSRYLTGARAKIPLDVFMGLCNVLDVKAEDLYRTLNQR